MIKKLFYKLKNKNKKRELTFYGWGMTTKTTSPPWTTYNQHQNGDVVESFAKCNEELISLISAGSFKLSQFSKTDNKQSVLDGLKWRHYIVYWSSHFALMRTKSRNKTFVECGVCDGLTAYYAMSAAKNHKVKFKAYLYDAWEAMQEDALLASELKMAGDYGYLDVDSTKNNLSLYSQNCVFNKGFIPDVFVTSTNPEHVTWLHIDLNSALATQASLEYFYPILEKGGVILFDDYGWLGYEDTKKLIDNFCRKYKLEFLQFPTGQAIIFN